MPLWWVQAPLFFPKESTGYNCWIWALPPTSCPLAPACPPTILLHGMPLHLFPVPAMALKSQRYSPLLLVCLGMHWQREASAHPCADLSFPAVAHITCADLSGEGVIGLIGLIFPALMQLYQYNMCCIMHWSSSHEIFHKGREHLLPYFRAKLWLCWCSTIGYD